MTAVVEKMVLEGKNVLIHCEDDSDTVPIISSIAKIRLDPFYRTFTGFQYLIEEEWLAMGFKFADRTGQIVSQNQNQSFYFCRFVLKIK